MKFQAHKGVNFGRVAKLLLIASFLLFFGETAFAQNTKGDRTEVKGSGSPRQNRFSPRSPKRAKTRTKSRRVSPAKVSLARISRYFEGKNSNVYSSRDRRFVNNKHRTPSNKQRPWRDDRSNSFVGQSSLRRNQNIYPQKKQRATESDSDRKRNVYSKSSQYVSNSHAKPTEKQRAWKGNLSGSRLRVPRSRTQRNSNIYSRYGQYSSNPSPKPRNAQTPASNGASGRKITPRSASASFIHHRTLNTNAGFWNVKRKSEVAVTTDIAGRPLRAKNFQTPTSEVVYPQKKPYIRSRRIGDHPYKASSGRRVVTRTSSSAAWSGDIAGRRIRGRNFTSKPRVESAGISTSPPLKRKPSGKGDRVYNGTIPGGGYNSVGRRGRQGMLPSKVPGIGADGTKSFISKIRGFKPIRGGGSRSGSLWNNKGAAIHGKQPGVGADGVGTFQGNLKGNRPLGGGGDLRNNKRLAVPGRQTGMSAFQGNLKGSRPLRGGGSRSGRLWNNKGVAIPGRQPGVGVDGVGGFQGNLKVNRARSGGGSRTGGLWNNKGNAILGRQPGVGADGVGVFQGNLKGNRPLRGGGSRSGRMWNNKTNAIPGRQPGIGVDGVGAFQGKSKYVKPFKIGGSRSGKLWNNKGTPIQTRPPGLAAQSGWTFSGSVKARKPLTGGGSRSGSLWNNKGIAIQRRTPGAVSQRMGSFQGDIVRRKPLHGGGSVGGSLWNNKTRPIGVRPPSLQGSKAARFSGDTRPLEQRPVLNNQGEEFTGFIKLRRADRKYAGGGGGSVSGRLWNNKTKPVGVHAPSPQGSKAARFSGHIKPLEQRPANNNQGEEFTGFIKLSRFDRKKWAGGGSVSGRLWNNKTKPIGVRPPSSQGSKAAKFSGTIKPIDQRTFSNQGEEFTGYTKLNRFFKKSYVRNKNSSDESLAKKRPTKSTFDAGDLQFKIERRDYVKNKNSAELALRKLAPTKSTLAGDGLQLEVERRSYVKNKNSAALALRKLEPTKSTLAGDGLQVKIKKYNYIHNSASASKALKVREPGSGFVRSSVYQGNVVIKKVDFAKLFSQKSQNLHPDTKFIKLNKNNVSEEKSVMTNIKLWWARTFRKNDTQPENLKDKGRKPRYDKGEQGLWND